MPVACSVYRSIVKPSSPLRGSTRGDRVFVPRDRLVDGFVECFLHPVESILGRVLRCLPTTLKRILAIVGVAGSAVGSSPYTPRLVCLLYRTCNGTLRGVNGPASRHRWNPDCCQPVCGLVPPASAGRSVFLSRERLWAHQNASRSGMRNETLRVSLTPRTAEVAR